MDINFSGKKILIMGLGLHGGGVGAARFFIEQGASVTITDLRTKKQLETSIAKLKKFPHITYILGRHRKRDILNTNLIVKNPGIPPSSPYIQFARKHNIPITTDISIFLRQCPATIIGVTGTRGKSTTCFLIFKFLEKFFENKKKQNCPRVFLAGNIRTSVLDILHIACARDIVVLELSSFQLDDIENDSWHSDAINKKSPHIAVITNILSDHLNWHKTTAEYMKAKSVIYKYQTSNDFLFINRLDTKLKKMIHDAHSHVLYPQLPSTFKSIIDDNLGSHYRSSVGLAIEVGKHFKIPLNLMKSILQTFRGLPGRQELILSVQGINIVNDTTATIPEASIAAIKRFRLLAKKHHLILIAGGSDKRLIFFKMAEIILACIDHLILLPGTATKKILYELKKKKNIRMVSLQKAHTMDQAVAIAFAHADKGDYLMLSPGAASFGLFANEFDRGDQFIHAVHNNLQN